MLNTAWKINTSQAVSTLTHIALTAGEPAGIGIDLCVMLASLPIAASIVVIADQQVLIERAHQLGLPLAVIPYQSGHNSIHQGNNTLNVLHIPVAAPVVAGQLDSRNGQYVLHTLERAIDGCVSHEFDAMVTAPVHKGIINDAGIAFTGHTEFLAERTARAQVVMMLVGGNLRVALATTHLPLAEVSQAITKESLATTIRILHHDLVTKFGISHPRILVTGLNPHAGEGGHLGMEEINVITPVLEALRSEGMQLKGPLPADTLFTQHNLQQGDCVLAMYHDQGLPVLKHASFGGGINVTLGLPIIRTSVDHGTALDLAGHGNIEIGSLLAAIDLAITLAQHGRKPA
ncbi:4-hydroxythreonine-4-phosphate dehydrogenase PdxA [Methylobacillus gramineus]|uniref:4-hydroxythreonine-4-phosphate dehydrogenase PdxA n=1 Tax=Methylobacillus gramineus TaxID=755169 RepID=UPI001CFFC00C|nr:4-hydroxythreonine-4-phosphate dehydrogenase PdxA [Methylobacillus gramineus]MCB5186321.1 4-hydroxythreonine-4-phosphate dehydrogenase PdxA [Methylobacillus gramineus]